MSVHTRKHHTRAKASKEESVYFVSEMGQVMRIPKSLAMELGQYSVKNSTTAEKVINKLHTALNVPSDDVFAELNEEYSKPGALLKGLRGREGLTQKELAAELQLQQGDLSKMENGKRPIGKKLAKKLAKKFDVNPKSFIEV